MVRGGDMVIKDKYNKFDIQDPFMHRSETECVLEEIYEERSRQKNVEGWTEEHDDKHIERELAVAAACYASNKVNGLWPWGTQHDKRMNHPYRKKLIIAAALLVAEIERIDRVLK